MQHHITITSQIEARKASPYLYSVQHYCVHVHGCTCIYMYRVPYSRYINFRGMATIIMEMVFAHLIFAE